MTQGNRESIRESAPCAFERDEHDVFQQIKDWEPEQRAKQ